MALKTLKLSRTDTQHTQKNCQELQFEEKKKYIQKIKNTLREIPKKVRFRIHAPLITVLLTVWLVFVYYMS